jgi:hypothetical protein
MRLGPTANAMAPPASNPPRCAQFLGMSLPEVSDWLEYMDHLAAVIN